LLELLESVRLLYWARLPPRRLLSDICGRHAHIRIDLAVFQYKKRYIEVFVTLSKQAFSLNLNTAKHNFSDKEESGSKMLPNKMTNFTNNYTKLQGTPTLW
jgi:hypothetical protein